ncbi:uncharacterized protein EV422DRAFT_53331 [Fimicolochytrium jonesii]|uniref:uncharacterized protein n=1 Tax=Fimicolochytrium jonesii TaxID=1396493 RepID=UPI0022FEF4C7|nr:uncharacterized protein EV422DRAFT_53331 [Fimicolochytrium jonesii]KAI8821102.1 hypothetical protein EV422DRAFT_53331 [Fimicolochytrium jonesii]
MRQTSLRSDTSEPLETSVHSSMHSSIGVPYRSARSHTRAAATAGSRPMLFPLMTGGGDTTPPESHTSLGGPKQLPNVVIVEGIDAASRSVYSALHEVIERGQVTDRNSVFPCPNPFLIIGITSPSAREQAIPQQLLDKFFLCHTLAAPPYRCIVTYPLKVPLLRFDDFERMTQSASFVYMHADVHSYLRDLITALRNHPSVGAGVSPKCGTDLMYAARLLALISGNQSITPDHVIAMTDKVLGHRLTPAHHSIYVPLDVRQRFKGLSGLDIIGDVLNTIPVPI